MSKLSELHERADERAQERSGIQEDPLVTHSLREARWIVAIWAVMFLWVVGYCSWSAYSGDGEDISMVLGMPHWVFWGIALPWCVSTVVTCWFALFGIADDSLERHSEPEGEHER